jgi:hypothetical protein
MEKAYAADFFDGEGYVGVNKHNQGYFLMVMIGQKDPAVLRWIADRWEGGLGQRSNGLWHWQAYAEKARTFIRDVQPYLIVKKAQVDYILQHVQPYREEHCLEMKRLKREFMEAIR